RYAPEGSFLHAPLGGGVRRGPSLTVSRAGASDRQRRHVLHERLQSKIRCSVSVSCTARGAEFGSNPAPLRGCPPSSICFAERAYPSGPRPAWGPTPRWERSSQSVAP